MRLPKIEDYPHALPSALNVTLENVQIFHRFLSPHRTPEWNDAVYIKNPDVRQYLSKNFQIMESARLKLVHTYSMEKIISDFESDTIMGAINIYFHFNYFEDVSNMCYRYTLRVVTKSLSALEKLIPVQGLKYE